MRFLFLSTFFLYVTIAFGQSPDLRFENISTGQKLSHNTSINAFRDNRGFLWIATMNGLNRYDGYSCKVYKHDPADSSSVSANFIHGIYEDSKGRLWITTRGGGLNLFDYQTERFYNYRHNPQDTLSISSNVVNAIIEINEGEFLIGTDKGLNIFSPDSGFFTRLLHDPDDIHSLSNSWVNYLLKTSDGSIWISTNYGLNLYTHHTRSFRRFYKGEGSLSHSFTTSLFEDTDGILWIGTSGGVLNSYNPRTKKFTDYSQQMIKSLGELPISINSLLSYDEDHLLIATEGSGVLLFNKNKLNFRAFKHDPANSSSVSSNIIVSLHKDHQGIIWLPTWGGGVDKLAPVNKNFDLYLLKDDKDAGKVVSNSIFAILKDKPGHVWLGTKSRNLVSYQLFDKEYREIILPHDNKVTASGIAALYQDHKNNLWIANEGLVKYYPGAESFEVFRYDLNNANTPGSNNIKCIAGTSDGIIWIGTEDRGASSYNPESQQWKRYFSHPDNPILVRTIHEDNDALIWMGTYKNGIIILNPETGDTTNFQHDPDNPFSLPNNDVRHITRTLDNTIWIATYGGGICYYDRSTARFYSIQEKDGLSNNFTYGILEDDNGDLWVSTNYGLNRYNRGANIFNHYTEKDGLQNNEFNTGAFFKTEDGEMLFGGVNGFNSFYPDRIAESAFSPPVFLTSFKIFDKEIALDSAIGFKKSVTLQHSDKFISAEFSALDFINPSTNNYAYKLEGFDKEWIYSGERRFASYTNLDPGRYTFKVKVSDTGDTWSNEETLINIIITPPYWKKAWFIILIALAAAILLVLIVRYYSTKKLKEQIRILEKEQLIQRERERISRDLHDNVGAQLTFLVSSIDNLTYSNDSTRILEKISDISNYGRKTIKELRNTIWAMKHSETELHELILKLNELKQEINSGFGNGFFTINNKIETSVKLKIAQALNIYRIIQEALQNVIKHARATQVELVFSETENAFQITLYDNGTGFDITEKSTGNGLSNMRSRCQEVNGFFEICSGNDGTTITCTFHK